MYHPPLFAAPSALHQITKIMTRIFQLQEKLKIQQEDNLMKPNQKINRTLKNIYRMHLSDETLILAFFYVDVITKKLRIFLNQNNGSALLVGTIMLADKYLNDEPQSIRQFSLVSGFSIQELIQIEQQFLEILEYNLSVSNTEFETYNQRVQNY